MTSEIKPENVKLPEPEQDAFVERMKAALAGPRFIVPRGLTAEQCVEFFNVVAEVQAAATALERERCAALCATEPTRWLAVDATGHESVTKCDSSEDPEAWLDFAVTPIFTAAQVRAAVLEATMTERERCAKACEDRSKNVQTANTYRGRVNQAALFVADQLELCASVIRAGHSVTETKRD